MGTVGVVTGTAYLLLGLPGALLLGLIAALSEAIPIVGPLLGAIPAILVAATVSPELALVVAALYLIIQLVEGSVLVPLVMRNTVGISPLLVLLSLLIGSTVGGLVGALLAVPVVAASEMTSADCRPANRRLHRIRAPSKRRTPASARTTRCHSPTPPRRTAPRNPPRRPDRSRRTPGSCYRIAISSAMPVSARVVSGLFH